MSATVAPDEERFAANANILGKAILQAITELYNKGYQTVPPLLVQIAVGVIASYDKHQLIQGFIENSHAKCWDSIRERDEEFFVENVGTVFRYLPTQQVDLFKDLYMTRDKDGKPVITDMLKTQIWNLFDSMIKISIKYIHNQRGPYADANGQHYKCDFYEDIDIRTHAEKWRLTLNFPMEI